MGEFKGARGKKETCSETTHTSHTQRKKYLDSKHAIVEFGHARHLAELDLISILQAVHAALQRRHHASSFLCDICRGRGKKKN